MTSDEVIIASHPEQEKVNRVVDLFHDRLKFENFSHPKKGSKLNDQWLVGFNAYLDNLRTSPDTFIIATDGSLDSSGSKAGFTAWWNGQGVANKTFHVNAYASYDVEIQALESALIWAVTFEGAERILLVDNDSAAKGIWDTNSHNLHYISINAMRTRPWPAKSTPHKITISWVPSYVGVPENEKVDSLVASHSGPRPKFRMTPLAHRPKTLLLENRKSWLNGCNMRALANNGSFLRLGQKKKFTPDMGGG
ncbi:hypothetical protein AX15_003008 [Amanita polypyramis BW_CC]|nr:hypothetical protein AX15_003008 [Amanita polypyramis BW_CC]